MWHQEGTDLLYFDGLKLAYARTTEEGLVDELREQRIFSMLSSCIRSTTLQELCNGSRAHPNRRGGRRDQGEPSKTPSYSRVVYQPSASCPCVVEVAPASASGDERITFMVRKLPQDLPTMRGHVKNRKTFLRPRLISPPIEGCFCDSGRASKGEYLCLQPSNRHSGEYGRYVTFQSCLNLGIRTPRSRRRHRRGGAGGNKSVVGG